MSDNTKTVIAFCALCAVLGFGPLLIVLVL